MMFYILCVCLCPKGSPTSSLWLSIMQHQDRSDFKLRHKGLILVSLQAFYPANT